MKKFIYCDRTLINFKIDWNDNYLYYFLCRDLIHVGGVATLANKSHRRLIVQTYGL